MTDTSLAVAESTAALVDSFAKGTLSVPETGLVRVRTGVTEDQLVSEAIAAREQATEAEAQAGSPHRWRMADIYLALSGVGWTQQRIAKECGVSQQLVSYYCKVATSYNPGCNRPQFQEAYREAQGGNVHFSSETPEWETPQALFDVLDAEFGFTLDVCATADNHKCERYFTVHDDGLGQPWTGICWMNPPYGSEIPKWVDKAHRSAVLGATVVCLVPARTDTSWWWEHCIAGEIRFLRGRLKFGESPHGAPFPSAVVVFGQPSSVKWWDEWPKD